MTPSRWRELAPGQRAQLTIVDRASVDEDPVDSGPSSRVVFETAESVIEAPNWNPGGDWLVFNSDGLLYRIKADGSGPPIRIPTGELNDSNNDHVLSPDGTCLFTSSQNGHLYRVPADGGSAQRVSDDADGLQARYLHGISPDGTTLALIGRHQLRAAKRFNIFTLSLIDGSTRQLTDSDHHHDGAEYSPDGEWIYFNSDRASTAKGHSQIFRMRPDGRDPQQLTFDTRVNWFPHLSPDGSSMVYLSYQSSVVGHPANKDVLLRQADPEGESVRTVAGVFGGQGTINVNSWAPDSQRFAYVAYPVRNR